MADNKFIEQTKRDSFQDRSDTVESPMPKMASISRLIQSGDIIAPWWSYQRDRQLREFWMSNDYLSGAMYNMVSKMTAIPFRIIPKSLSNPEWVEQAEIWQEHLESAPEFGDGWITWYKLWVTDLLGYDNGTFSEITGKGSPSGAIRGMPGTVQHLDSQRSIRTGDTKYPVMYQDTDGKLYKLHYTRVMYDSQMPSTDVLMNKVGLCSISRAINVAQTLLDILVYKQEKLGSRPARAVGVTQGGLDPLDIKSAFDAASTEMTQAGLKRYSRHIFVGSGTQPDADLKIVDLASLPDGFDEADSITLGMATIALAFGVDARDLFPMTGVGATRADALLQHIKQRGKAPGQIIESTERQFSRKFLPYYLTMIFDYQDDTQDRQEAEIQKIRSERRQRDLEVGVTDMRTEREEMLSNGDITKSQFASLELSDGRLDDGTSVLTLFYKDNPMLDLGVEDPLNVDKNDPITIVESINVKLAEANRVLANTSSRSKKTSAEQASAALNILRKMYVETSEERTDNPEPVRSYPLRREDLTRPNEKVELSTDDSLRPTKDDVLKSIESYQSNLRGAVRGLWSGVIDEFGFAEQMTLAINRGMRQAFEEGAQKNGILPSDYTDAEWEIINSAIASQVTYIDNFADYISQNNRDSGGKLEPLFSRLQLWVNKYQEIVEQASIVTGENKKYKWVTHAGESCESCKKLNGKIKRASFWDEKSLYPGCDILQCMQGAKGVPVCKCTLEETDEPATRGPLPII